MDLLSMVNCKDSPQTHAMPGRPIASAWRLAWLAACLLATPWAPAAPLPDQPSARQRCAATDAANAPRLFAALGKDHHAALKKMLAAGDNPNPCHGGRTPLMIAAAAGDAEALHLLHQAGAVIDAPRDAQQGGTALHAALSAGQWRAAAVLLERGADTRLRDDDGNTGLHHLANSAHGADPGAQAALADSMLKLGAAIDATGPQASTPLMLAIDAGKRDLAALLVDQGADPFLRNARGENALAIARRRALPAMIDMLERCTGPRAPRCAGDATAARYSTK
ncbi:ankyrin repeat domain-containing protein [Massilia violaceinigra]|uniref:Ankyrin repeat domain-containing protein n=1 Tax=Massilia violaceinigra TaxID=2045208 RepID=A0ABY4A431_9BURK|nr:ankyrin repeat domain-containing protein [Massilia violaceinigra]UOD27428.1 ankyrin repeat domain-containing protein [Massilia violaceinigra]